MHYLPTTDIDDEKFIWDQLDVCYRVDHENMWVGSNVEKNRYLADDECSYAAVIDTYKAVSQLCETRRILGEKRYFGGLVGQKLSKKQLMSIEPIGAFHPIGDALRDIGLTTEIEYESLVNAYYQGFIGDLNEGLLGKTRHRAINWNFALKESADTYIDMLRSKPFVGGLHCSSEGLSCFGSDDRIFVSYDREDNKYGHALMVVGEGSCTRIGNRGSQTVPYFVAQNNWEDSPLLVRFSDDLLNLGISFDVAP